MLLVIDRFEGLYAVCQDMETENMVHFERSRLPGGAKENDILRFENDILTIDVVETLKRKKEIDELMDGLWK